jgi:GH25 family lysozyme M1 (1,4-beta-N-acetylmuramidase)
MPSFNRLFRGFSSIKSSSKTVFNSPLIKRFIESWKLLASKRLAVVPVAAIVALAMALGAGRAAAQHPVGIDVSDYQTNYLLNAGPSPWVTLKNTYSIVFGWAKASEGQGTSGGTSWPTYCTYAKAAGIMIGPYHYARYDLNTGTNGAIAEANFFWNTVKANIQADGLTIVPMLDVEAATNGYTATTLSQWVNAWCTTVSNNAYAAGFKLKPAIYGSSSHIVDWFDNTVTNWNLDVADYPYAHSDALSEAQAATTPPAGIAPWHTWQFWQYDDENAGQATTTGDGDIFNGTLAQLQSTMLVIATGPTITSQPASVTAVVGTNVNFSVTATGGGTIQYQWKFNSTNISSAVASKYTINNVQTTNAGMYAVSVKDNSGNSVLSSGNVYLAVVGPVTNQLGSTVVAPPGMVDWWPADGNGNDIFGTVTAIPGTNLSYSPGVIGLAFQFNGSSSYLTTGAADIPVPWTACMWVKRASGAGDAAGLLEDGTYSLKLEQFSNTFNVGISVLAVGDYVFSPAYTAPIGTWVHLAFVGTSAGTSLYVNGTLQGSLTNSIPLPRAYIGAGYVTSSSKYIDFLSGSLDEIMLFNQALSGAQISSIYSAGSSGLVRAGQITGSSSPAPGQYTLNMRGETGKTLTIYTSTDLTNWVSSAKIGNSTGSNNWTDVRATNNPAKFYRVSSP